MLKDDSYKTGTSSSAIFAIAVLVKEKQLNIFFFDAVIIHAAARKVMFERIGLFSGRISVPQTQHFQIFKFQIFSHDQFHTSVNEHLLLAPSDVCNITKKDDRQIKDALFEYLTTVERSL